MAKAAGQRKRGIEAYERAIDGGVGIIAGVDYHAEALAGMAQMQIATPGA